MKPEIIEKNGSWAYSIGGMEFGSYPSREAALIAADKHSDETPRPTDASDDGGPRRDDPQD
ncbi:hypothetical protein IHQ68_09415 [Chelatococcus sambhunathii]|uniref:DUF2188 domain-containing protein n=1 Tax=Chelatococcus sambhunathii TaxID=363953 RepID=A0ABU1DFL0_9HYPH|nr:hypothetical protein [Chelatococcus sambhunathii]MDR4306835.1 hypothetical protein [Chelatococcus sambhunathii]